MTPNITPFLQEADRRRPELKIINTKESCFELLELTLALAGPEWSFIGKTSAMDGAAVTPRWFQPREMLLRREDGQQQSVLITGLGMDAAWHVPSGRQIKVIGNSSANDDTRPEIHGPANLNSYEIPTKDYRWHNPAIAQHGGAAVPMPTPTPAPSPAPQSPTSQFRIPSYAELGDDAFFRAQIGVPLQADMTTAGQVLNDGSSVWFSRGTYLLVVAAVKAFLNGGSMADVDAPAIVKSVRNEWRANLTKQGATGLPPLP